MALDELLRTLEDEARTRMEDVLGRARAEATALREAAAAGRTARREATLRARELELRAGAARELEAARRGATRRVLEARAGALHRIRRAAASGLARRAGDPALLPRLRGELADGLGYMGEGPVVIEASEALLPDLRRAMNGRPDVTFVAGPAGGLVLRAADGSLVVDASLETRLDRAWPALAIELVRRMEEAP